MEHEPGQIFEYCLFTEPPEEERREGVNVNINVIFRGEAESKRFRITVVHSEKPNGIILKGYGDLPPMLLNDHLINYIMEETMGAGGTGLRAIGEMIHMICLNYVKMYYVKLPYMGEDAKSSRWYIIPCGKPGDRHCHLVELDDVTKEPVDLDRDMDEGSIHDTIGEALEALCLEHFRDFDVLIRKNPIEKLTQMLMGRVKEESEDDEKNKQLQQQLEQHEQLEQQIASANEAKEEIETPTDLLQRMWDAGTNDDE